MRGEVPPSTGSPVEMMGRSPTGAASIGAERSDESFHTAWVAALDELELDVTSAEALIVDARAAAEMPAATESGPWAPPSDLGPLPLVLRGRAEAIHQRQIRAATALAAAMAGNRRQSALITRLDSGFDGGDRPAYVDWAL